MSDNLPPPRTDHVASKTCELILWDGDDPQAGPKSITFAGSVLLELIPPRGHGNRPQVFIQEGKCLVAVRSGTYRVLPV